MVTSIDQISDRRNFDDRLRRNIFTLSAIDLRGIYFERETFHIDDCNELRELPD